MSACKAGQSLVEKVAQRYAVGGISATNRTVRCGDFVEITPHRIMTHDNSGSVIQKFDEMGAQTIANPAQLVLALDHNVQDRSEENIAKYRKIANFAAEHGVEFHPAGRGIGHQVLVEEGHVVPGALVMASDSHSNMYGGLGALGSPLVRTDAAAVWATGRTWWQVPPTARVNLHGTLPSGATAKDLIIMLCGHFRSGEVLNHAVEFAGDGLASLSVDDRFTVANMSTEWGALAGVFPADDITFEWLCNTAQRLDTRRDQEQARRICNGDESDAVAPAAGERGCAEHANGEVVGECWKDLHPRLSVASLESLEAAAALGELRADPDASYARELSFDLSTVQPHVAGPNHVKLIEGVASLSKRRVQVHKAYVVSCVNSRVSDLAAAADVLRDREVAPGVELYVAAASSEVQQQSEHRGDWEALLAAGAKPLPPGCGPCVGLGQGLLNPGEVGISATNRNFKGRMGARDAKAYLASPAVVAASAVAGFITGPAQLDATMPVSVQDLGNVEAMTHSSDLGANARASARADGSDTGGEQGAIFSAIEASKEDSLPTAERKIVPGFPKVLEGAIMFCPANDIDTDGIFAGAHTYKHDMSEAEMAAVVMENYDPGFAAAVRPGDILVGGHNFGCGSSREQAATALKAAGVKVVVAASFSQTFKRNGFNNALICVECPQLVSALRKRTCASAHSERIDARLCIDFRRSSIEIEDGTAAEDGVGTSFASSLPCLEFRFQPLGEVVQQLVTCGGLLSSVSAKLNA